MTEVISRNTKDRLFLFDETLFHHVEGDVHGGETSALTVTGLQHPEFPLFDGKLDILHIAKVLLKLLTNDEKFFVRLGKIFGHLGDGLRCANTRYNILTLGVDEILTVEYVFAGSRITSESNSGSGGLTSVTEDHGLHVNSGSPSSGNTILLTVNCRAVVLP